MESARDFLNSYNSSTSTPRSVNNNLYEEVIRSINGLLNYLSDRVGCLDIAHRTATIRRHTEELRSHALTMEELDIANNLYDLQTFFKCPKLWCNYFTTGFAPRKDHTKHVDCHERPFCCPEDECFVSRLGFGTKENLNKHRYDQVPFTSVCRIEILKKAGQKTNDPRGCCHR